MSLITATQLAKSYDPKDIFSDISLGIPQRARIALVGPNGIGKTTLLRILVGLEEPSAGKIHRAHNIKIGYLPQEAILSGSHTLWEECLGAFSTLREQEAELARLEAEMSHVHQSVDALARYGSLQQAFDLKGGYTYELRMRQTLAGLGFEQSDYQRPLSQLSGGQRTRALLARLLLSQPDLLILDEPTNHLDIQAVEWLEGFLSQWEGATLIVSHDRYFLDRVVDHVWELNREGLETYRGNYSAYLQQRQDRWLFKQQIFEAEKERLEKDLDYIRRNIAGQNTIQAKGRLKRLSRYLSAIEKGDIRLIREKKWAAISEETGAKSQIMSIEEVTQHLKSLRNPISRPRQLSLRLRTERRSGDLVIQTQNLFIGYADEQKPLFEVPDLVLKRGECAALIGPNGAGKTTFLKTLLGTIPPFSGEVILGASLDVAYFAQAHEDLNPDHNLLTEIEAIAPHLLVAEIRNHLARFLFTDDDVYKKVSTLSGGERGRLALAKLALTHANLLLLDEPTNHLDIPSQEILQEVMAEYPGTILLVSHDRYLIDALSTQVWEIDPDQTSLTIFPGSYSDYHAFLEAQKSSHDSQVCQSSTKKKRSRNKSTTNIDKKRNLRLAEVEVQITQLETKLARLSQQLEAPPAELKKVQQMGNEYNKVQREIDTLVAEWERLQSNHV